MKFVAALLIVPFFVLAGGCEKHSTADLQKVDPTYKPAEAH